MAEREMATQPTYLSFRPRARLIRTIGDRLISGPEAAVIELIKNAHDADATRVRVTFTPPLRIGHGHIVVDDDGHGMTLDDIHNKWMEPATTDKIERVKSPRGRRLVGSKGIGRFAAARLGSKLEMITTGRKSDGSLETTILPDVDWEAFERAKYLSEVEFRYEVLPPVHATGTRLHIIELRDDWTEDRIRHLHDEMRRLISPLEKADQSDFKIFLDLAACTPSTAGFNGDELVNGTFPDEGHEPFRVLPFPILKACDYEVEGTFDADGRFEGVLTIHRGDQRPESIRLEIPLDADRAESPCGMVLVHLYIFDRETSAIAGTIRKAGLGRISVKEARQILDRVSGVAIYRDQFRIRPYGDSENDWLTLDTRRVQAPAIRIGHNQVSGILVIDSEGQSGLIERSSREGLEYNGSFRRLQRLLLELFAQQIEPRRLKFREDVGLDRRPRSMLQDAYRSAKFAWVRDVIAKIPEPERVAAEAVVQKESDRLVGYLENLEQQQATLQARVTLGLIVGEVLHDGRAPVTFIHHEAVRLTRWLDGICDETEAARQRREEIPRILRGLTANSEKLRTLLSSLEPLSGARRGKPLQYYPSQVVRDALQIFESRLQQMGIVVHINADSSVRSLVGYPADLRTAITQIVDNAIYWLDHHQIANPSITVDVRSRDDSCVVQLVDNGRGIPEEFIDRIFDVGFTLKPSGTGLGLSIAREALARSGGEIEVMDDVTGAGFRMTLRSIA